MKFSTSFQKKIIFLGTATLSLPYLAQASADGDSLCDLRQAGQTVHVSGKLEGWVQDQLNTSGDLDSGLSTSGLSFIETRTKKSYSLKGLNVPQSLQSGSFATAQISSDLSDGSCHIQFDQPVGITAAFGTPSLTSAGEQKTLVMLLSYNPNHQIGQAEISLVRDVMFGPVFSVDQLYRQSSHGQVSFSGDVTGPYVVSESDACNYRGDAAAADARALADGIDLSRYTRKIYVYGDRPSSEKVQSRCRWVGLGSFGSIPTQAWIVYHDSGLGLFGHEVGHNLGMHHAGRETSDSLDCDFTGAEGTTRCSEGGDRSDVLGSGLSVQSNAPHRTQTGWLTGNQVQSITQPGVYSLAPLEEDPAILPNIARTFVLHKPDTNDDYYLSYRIPRDLDETLPDQFKYRLNIHRWKTGRLSQTILMGTLADSESFFDRKNEITFQNLGTQSDGTLRFHVSMGSESCERVAPEIKISPQEQKSSPGGAPVSYRIEVLNRDSEGCETSGFQMTAGQQEGIELSWVNTLLQLNPGETATTLMTVSSQETSTLGKYTINVQALSTDGVVEHQANAQAVFELTSDCIPSKPSIGIFPGYQTIQVGDQADIMILLRNWDDRNCQASTFTLSAFPPENSTAEFSENQITLEPGRMKVLNLKVKTLRSILPAEYLVRVTTKDAVNTPEHNNFTHAALKVLARD